MVFVRSVEKIVKYINITNVKEMKDMKDKKDEERTSASSRGLGDSTVAPTPMSNQTRSMAILNVLIIVEKGL